jgi:hypothetical protein
MGYLRAEEVLPRELIEMIQQYTDGTNIYIPRRDEVRSGWGRKTRPERYFVRGMKRYIRLICQAVR